MPATCLWVKKGCLYQKSLVKGKVDQNLWLVGLYFWAHCHFLTAYATQGAHRTRRVPPGRTGQSKSLERWIYKAVPAKQQPFVSLSWCLKPTLILTTHQHLIGMNAQLQAKASTHPPLVQNGWLATCLGRRCLCKNGSWLTKNLLRNSLGPKADCQIVAKRCENQKGRVAAHLQVVFPSS